MKKRSLLMTCVLAASLCLVACKGDYGKTVEQGRCVAYADGKVTFVEDSNVNPKMSADFSKGNVLTFAMPKDPKEIGPEPIPGNLISFDKEKKEVRVFKDGAMQTLAVDIVNVQTGVERHNSAVKGKTFPMLDKNKGEVTLYMNKVLATIKLPSGLPNDEAFWKVGDDVRVYFKEKGQALRFMNITKTNIFKK